jgi:hypothetical protein
MSGKRKMRSGEDEDEGGGAGGGGPEGKEAKQPASKKAKKESKAPQLDPLVETLCENAHRIQGGGGNLRFPVRGCAPLTPISDKSI